MQKTLIYIFALALVTYLGYQVYILQSERVELKDEYGKIEQGFNNLEEENIKLKEEIEYLSEPYNLEKELRSRFNYKLPQEKLIIIVPKEDDATSTQQ